MAVGPTSFNPHIIKNENNEYLLLFRVNDWDQEWPICDGANTNNKNTNNNKYNIVGNISANTMNVGVSKDINGPWTVYPVTINGFTSDYHHSNPSLIQVLPHCGNDIVKNGTYLLSYRYNGITFFFVLQSNGLLDFFVFFYVF